MKKKKKEMTRRSARPNVFTAEEKRRKRETKFAFLGSRFSYPHKKKKKKPVIELCVRHKLRNFVRVRVTFFFSFFFLLLTLDVLVDFDCLLLLSFFVFALSIVMCAFRLTKLAPYSCTLLFCAFFFFFFSVSSHTHTYTHVAGEAFFFFFFVRTLRADFLLGLLHTQ